MASQHTYGESCMLREEGNTFTRRASSVAIDPPKITAQFFYCSSLPIDDPLAAVPAPSGNAATRSSRVPPRPFSVHDNLALDQAWLNLGSEKITAQERRRSRAGSNRKRQASTSELLAPAIFSEPDAQGMVSPRGYIDSESSLGKRAMKPEKDNDASSDGRAVEIPTEQDPIMKPSLIEKAIHEIDHPVLQDTEPVTAEELVHHETEIPRTRHTRSFFHRKEKDEKPTDDNVSPRSSARRLSRGRQEDDESPDKLGRSPDTTGTPFLRIPSRLRRSRSQSPHRAEQNVQLDGATSPERDYRPKHSSPLGVKPRFAEFPSTQGTEEKDHAGPEAGFGSRRSSSGQRRKSRQIEAVQVTVGVPRLHVVEMPSLKMGPVYWDPVHDVSSVVRGTWFYKDTMWPVESELANKIEEGYEYMKPWTPTYVDELNSCMDIGAEAELKVTHMIWPAEEPNADSHPREIDKYVPLSPEERGIQEAKAVAGMASNRAAGILEGFEPPGVGRLFARSSIIYADGKDAQILKPTQVPSAAKGRRPLGNIRKGKAVGIPIIRGFDMKAWEKINPLPNRAIPVPQPMTAESARSLKRRKSCLACETAQERPSPTDLILVVHGIGQKLSERVESFHFTHAINSFRRQINVELANEMVKPWLRQDLGGVMVLPINWRSTLKLDDSGSETDTNPKLSSSADNQFSLKDITAESLPAVRNLISDVMLDIPYYLSHHKPKMIEAVIAEANRVYRLWCINNPGFHEFGRVHLLAHSLGSVMALDILSKQPTKLPQHLNYPKSSKLRSDIFEFDTKSLFFCGSPAGFFLLLNRASLVPRNDRNKPEAETDGTDTGVSGRAGTFGCLAVDNLYNIMHYNDPVAYCLNACVDVDYAASLKPAYVPSASQSWGQYIGSYFRSKAIAPAKTMTGLNDLPRRPTAARLPTTVELETHDFTREEVAEKRMFLLNDNGQIDYTLPSGGGPLEIQYLNMLGAHSSYWTRKDFVRFLVVEVGRKQGRSETMNGFKAVKKAFGKK